MTTKRTLVAAWAVSAMVLAAPVAMALAPLTFNDLTGSLRIQQRVPCGGLVDVTTSIAAGRMDIFATEMRGLPVRFDLTRLEVFFTPFSVQHQCRGIGATAEFREIGVRLAGAISFTGEAVGDPADGLYRFSIAKEQFRLYESVIDNAPVPQPESRYNRPSEDVTGQIDLRRGTVALHVALTSRLHFRAGCVGGGCAIDEAHDGTQTVDVSGVIRRPGATSVR